MENGINNGVPNSEATQFTSDRQPTPEQKRAGWERKREAQEIADEMMKIKNMSYAELKNMQKDVKAHPENYTVMQVKLMQYMSNERLTINWIDRHLPNAPQKVDIDGRINLTAKDVIEELKKLDDEPIN